MDQLALATGASTGCVVDEAKGEILATGESPVMALAKRNYLWVATVRKPLPVIVGWLTFTSSASPHAVTDPATSCLHRRAAHADPAGSQSFLQSSDRKHD